MIIPTGVTSTVYWNAIKAGNPTHVSLSFSGQGITLDDQDIDINGGLTITDIFNGDTDLVFGKAVCKELTVNILNSDRLDGLNWEGEFTLRIGVDTGTPAVTRWARVGIFTGKKPNNITTAKVIKFTAYDRMTKFDILADKFFESLTYPITVNGIYDALCTYVGVSSREGDELPNIMNREYASAPVDMTGYTCRDILAWIAEACGCYARMDQAGYCKMIWFTDNTSRVFTGDDEYHVEAGDIRNSLSWDEADTYTWDEFDTKTWDDVCGTHEINDVDQIQVKQLGTNVNINYPSDNGQNIYMIVDNPFLSVSNADDITNYIAPLYIRIFSFGNYIPARIETIGCCLIEAGDIIVANVDGKNIYVPIFAKTIRWNGAANDTYETTGNNQRKVYATSADKQQAITAKYIRLFVEDNYYHTQSGIEITADGVTISGNKYVLIEAANNYRWVFNNIGLSLGLTGQEYYGMKFWIGQNSDDDQTTFVRNTMTGIGFHKNITYSAEDSYYELSFISAMEYSENGQTYHLYNNLQWGGSPLGHWALRPDGHGTADIGEPDNYFGDGYVARICGCGGYKRVDIIPDKQNDTQTRLRVTVDNDHLNVFKQGTSAKTLLMTGDVCGGMIGQTSSVSDLNSLTTPGHYWLTIDSNVANKPSAISSQYCEVIVTRTPVSSWTDVHQVILANDGGIYYRVGWAGSSFNAWKKVTTT